MLKHLNRIRKLVSWPWIATFFLVVIFFNLVAGPTNQIAAKDSAGRLYIQYYDPCEGNQGLLPNTSDAIVSMITGKQGNPDTAVACDPNATASSNGGAIFELASLTDNFYNYPSSSGIIWAQDQYQQIVGGKAFLASAQSIEDPNNQRFYFPGLGYQVLQPVAQFWQWSRNLVYAFFIIILVVIAFLTLFRTNLGGQEAVTLANSLPSIILSLILVTLSYPICGLFIDMIYLGSGFVQSVMITAPGAPGHDLVFDENGNERKLLYDYPIGGDILSDQPAINILQPDDRQLSIWNILSTSGANVCGDAEKCTLGNLVPDALSMDNSGRSNPFSGALGLFVNAATENSIINTGSILGLVLAVGAFTVAFKLFMIILQNYILLSFYPILAPWIFLGAAIPSRTSDVIQNFVRSLLGASLTFIVLYAVMLFLVIIGHSNEVSTSSAFFEAGKLNWAPPLAGYSSTQLQASGDVLRAIVAFGIFMSLPSIPDFIQNLLKIPSAPDIVKQTGERASATAKQTASGVTGIFGKLAEKPFGGK